MTECHCSRMRGPTPGANQQSHEESQDSLPKPKVESTTTMTKARTVEVTCQCGHLLFDYYKGGRGRLIKCYLDQIRSDSVGLRDRRLGARPVCPSCGKGIGTIRIVRGRPALKINQGAVRRVRI